MKKQLYADRLSSIEEFYFSKKLKEVQKLRQAGKPVINMGIGNPDFPPPVEAIEALKKVSSQPDAHGYQSHSGIPELHEAISQFYHHHFKVNLDPESNCLPLMGSREGIFHINMAFLNPRDQVLIPELGYAPYTNIPKLLGAEPVHYQMSERTQYLPDLQALEQQDLSKVKLMWINYPHLPTGKPCTKSQFKTILDFANKHGIILVNDTPYSLILNEEPTSLLSVEGAMDSALELNSLSKSFNLAGWRLGMVAGNPDFIQAILKIKSNVDNGMFLGLQRGAVEALKVGSQWFKDLNSIYAKRREWIYKFADKLECTYEKNLPGLYIWAKLKDNMNAEALVDHLLYEKHIFVTPGGLFGNSGKNHLRLSLCVNEDLIQEAIDRI